MSTNPFSALPVSSSEDEEIYVEESAMASQPKVEKPRQKRVWSKVDLTGVLGREPSRLQSRGRGRGGGRSRPPQAMKSYHRTKDGRLVLLSGAEAASKSKSKPMSNPRQAPVLKSEFPSIGGAPSKSQGPKSIGSWSGGIDGVRSAKDLPDPAHERRQEVERRLLWLRDRREKDAYVNDDDELPPLKIARFIQDDQPTPEPLDSSWVDEDGETCSWHKRESTSWGDDPAPSWGDDPAPSWGDDPVPVIESKDGGWWG